jgi:hypothetical protein
VSSDPHTDDRWLCARPNDLVSETLSDETLVIDVATGVFFTMRGTGSALWTMLEHTATIAELRQAVTDTFGTPAHDDVDGFVAALEAVGLVVEAPGPRADPSPVAATWPPTYEPPLVKPYEDMADLLLVDPIHDVAADAGWPERA